MTAIPHPGNSFEFPKISRDQTNAGLVAVSAVGLIGVTAALLLGGGEEVANITEGLEFPDLDVTTPGYEPINPGASVMITEPEIPDFTKTTTYPTANDFGTPGFSIAEDANKPSIYLSEDHSFDFNAALESTLELIQKTVDGANVGAPSITFDGTVDDQAFRDWFDSLSSENTDDLNKAGQFLSRIDLVASAVHDQATAETNAQAKEVLTEIAHYLDEIQYRTMSEMEAKWEIKFTSTSETKH